jgi:hypothetical protein
LDVFEPLDGAPRLPLSTGGTTLRVGRFLVPPSQGDVAPRNPSANFGGSLAFLGFAAANSAGQTLQVNVDWQVTSRLACDCSVFVHLLDADGKLVSQSDSQPDGGRFPTSLLPPGLRLRDRHTLPLENLPAGQYQLEIGVYDPQNGSRLQIAGTQTDSLLFPETLSR